MPVGSDYSILGGGGCIFYSLLAEASYCDKNVYFLNSETPVGHKVTLLKIMEENQKAGNEDNKKCPQRG